MQLLFAKVADPNTSELFNLSSCWWLHLQFMPCELWILFINPCGENKKNGEEMLKKKNHFNSSWKKKKKPNCPVCYTHEIFQNMLSRQSNMSNVPAPAYTSCEHERAELLCSADTVPGDHSTSASGTGHPELGFAYEGWHFFQMLNE